MGQITPLAIVLAFCVPARGEGILRPIPLNILCGHLILTAGSIAFENRLTPVQAKRRLTESVADFRAKLREKGADPTGPIAPVSASHQDKTPRVEERIIHRLIQQRDAIRDNDSSRVTLAVEVEGPEVGRFIRSELIDDVSALLTYQTDDYRQEAQVTGGISVALALLAQAILSGAAWYQEIPQLHKWGALVAVGLGLGYQAGTYFSPNQRAWRRSLRVTDERWGQRVTEMQQACATNTSGAWVFHGFDLPGVYLNEDIETSFRSYSAGAGIRHSLLNLRDIRVDVLLHVEHRMRRLVSETGVRPRLNLYIHGTPD